MELITNIILALVFVAMILAAHVADYYQENKDDSDAGTDESQGRRGHTDGFTDW